MNFETSSFRPRLCVVNKYTQLSQAYEDCSIRFPPEEERGGAGGRGRKEGAVNRNNGRVSASTPGTSLVNSAPVTPGNEASLQHVVSLSLERERKSFPPVTPTLSLTCSNLYAAEQILAALPPALPWFRRHSLFLSFSLSLPEHLGLR